MAACSTCGKLKEEVAPEPKVEAPPKGKFTLVLSPEPETAAAYVKKNLDDDNVWNHAAGSSFLFRANDRTTKPMDVADAVNLPVGSAIVIAPNSYSVPTELWRSAASIVHIKPNRDVKEILGGVVVVCPDFRYAKREDVHKFLNKHYPKRSTVKAPNVNIANWLLDFVVGVPSLDHLTGKTESVAREIVYIPANGSGLELGRRFRISRHHVYTLNDISELQHHEILRTDNGLIKFKLPFHGFHGIPSGVGVEGTPLTWHLECCGISGVKFNYNPQDLGTSMSGLFRAIAGKPRLCERLAKTRPDVVKAYEDAESTGVNVEVPFVPSDDEPIYLVFSTLNMPSPIKDIKVTLRTEHVWHAHGPVGKREGELVV
jgi:hypothetical protein